MRFARRLLLILLGLALLTFGGTFTYLVIAPPDLLQVGAGYSSKIVCSSVYLSGRDPADVLEIDVQSSGNPLLNGFTVDVDGASRVVRAAFLRYIAPMAAIYRPGLGCTSAPNVDLSVVSNASASPSPRNARSDVVWPDGEAVDLDGQDALAPVLGDPSLSGPGMRAIVVVEDGVIVGERYSAGFDAQTPLLGWSMTKTVTGALVGIAIDQGLLSLDQSNLFPQWEGDDRSRITVGQLLSMSSGLRFNESYGDVSDVNRMLFLEPDMAAFVAGFPLEHSPGSTFSYSSGTTVLLSRIWQDAIRDQGEALDWPRQVLFGPTGMESAVLEVDAAGTFVGSSYLYATARDWARFGLLLLNKGEWFGRQVLPRDFVELMITPAETNPVYGRGQVWLAGKEDSDFDGDDLVYGIPDDAFWLRGHDGQTVTVIPSAGIVVVRMGYTPSDTGYRSQRLVGTIVNTLRSE